MIDTDIISMYKVYENMRNMYSGLVTGISINTYWYQLYGRIAAINQVLDNLNTELGLIDANWNFTEDTIRYIDTQSVYNRFYRIYDTASWPIHDNGITDHDGKEAYNDMLAFIRSDMRLLLGRYGGYYG